MTWPVDVRKITYWMLVIFIIAVGAKILFFPTNYEDPSKLPSLVGCFRGPMQANVRLVQFDRLGRMSIAGRTIHVAVTSDKHGDFIVTKNMGVVFDQVGSSLVLRFIDDEISIDLADDLTAIAFVNMAGGRVVFGRSACDAS